MINTMEKHIVAGSGWKRNGNGARYSRKSGVYTQNTAQSIPEKDAGTVACEKMR